LERTDEAAVARAGIVHRAGFTLDQWEKVVRDGEAANIRAALLQRLLKLGYEEAASRLGRACRLGLLHQHSEFGYRVTELLCSVCQEKVSRHEGFAYGASGESATSSPATSAPAISVSADRPVRERIPAQMRFRVLTRDHFRCRYCGRTAEEAGAVLQMDHVIPVSNGGETSEDNLITACNTCNNGKSNKAVLPI
jgi:hypothetical protein